MNKKVISVGYQQREIGDFVQMLVEHGVEKLIDVRALPLSRKKGFSKKALSSHLRNAGIAYTHLRAAGNPYRKLAGDIDYCLTLYSSYLNEHPDVIELVNSELSTESPVAILCYERNHSNCHRSILLNLVQKSVSGVDITKVE
jgi:uncharacterized protein (DUF488 family)